MPEQAFERLGHTRAGFAIQQHDQLQIGKFCGADRQAGKLFSGGDQDRSLGIANDVVKAVGWGFQADIDHHTTRFEDAPEGTDRFDAVAQAHHDPLLTLQAIDLQARRQACTGLVQLCVGVGFIGVDDRRLVRVQAVAGFQHILQEDFTRVHAAPQPPPWNSARHRPAGVHRCSLQASPRY
ncbi:hypothetical protein D3C78_877060 [compost metagenome]